MIKKILNVVLAMLNLRFLQVIQVEIPIESEIQVWITGNPKP